MLAVHVTVAGMHRLSAAKDLRTMQAQQLRTLEAFGGTTFKAAAFLKREGLMLTLVHRLAYNGDVVAFKMGRRQGARRAHI